MTVLRPSADQLAWQRDRLGVFFHFGLNTFADKEWSDGTLSPDLFDPTDFDAEQWVDVAKSAGAKYVVLTAKHHDGFCLWPTATTDYSVAASPWREGRGDVVAELASACRRAGMKLGLYLSPWDRNAECYSDPERYDDFYLEQLTELCSNYGELSEIWFDGAGSEGRSYDWARIGARVRELQPHAMVFNMGFPTIRWVGNEDGLASDPVEYVVRQTQFSNYTLVVSDLADALYLPPECDVSIRPGWFWHAAEEPKALDHLLAIWYRSVGMGANLLLNLPPNPAGRIPDEDVARLGELTVELGRRFETPIPAMVRQQSEGSWLLDFGAEVGLDHLVLEEELEDGQRVVAHEVLDETGNRVVAGLTIGAQRVHVFPQTRARSLTLNVDGHSPRIVSVTGYATGAETIPAVAYLAPTEHPE